MKTVTVSYVLLMILAVVCLACENAESCTQGNVDGCYLEVGCESAQTCSLTTDEMNHLCVCLEESNCDQDWFHSFCDDAPYEEGECGSCEDDEPDAAP